jgi:hAT family C-terminal dimerisation region
MAPLSFWRENQHRFPSLAALARDALSIPATGAGVERLFNTARDICHYRRGRLNSDTIQELMMYLCTSKFDIEDEEATRLAEFFSRDEIEAAKEEKDDKPDEIELDPISDTEEQDVGLENNEDLDEAPEPPVSSPETHTQLRASGRKRKSREDDGFEYH